MLGCRRMKENDDGWPGIGATSRTLGVRPGIDIRMFSTDGKVYPGLEGMSVSPSPPENLPRSRRPPQFGGTGKDAVFELDTDDLPEELVYRPDPSKPDVHGLLTPAYTMTFEHYQRAIHQTRHLWRLL
jgi:hypothetical protein